jgi:UDP-2-acetamido-3-amino-2,3-dideoxy-glucuronate N-acetyltransferase
MNPDVHPTAIVDPGAEVGAGTKIWHFCHVMPGARIGAGCVLGQNVFVGGAAIIGDGCKVENNVSVFDAVRLEDDVFVGPSVVFTNVRTPRAFISRKAELQPTRVGRGATIGANATIVCGRTLGAYCFVAAGAVVTHDVPPHALVAGVPARPRGWVCVCGLPLRLAPVSGSDRPGCPDCGREFVFQAGHGTDAQIALWSPPNA